MNEPVLAPYFHPTTIVFVDDNAGFLQSLEFDLPEDLSYVSYLFPEEALAAINSRAHLPTLYERCYGPLIHDPQPGAAQIDLKVLEREIDHINRFNRFSTVMIDYSMPNISGLEFSRQIEDPYIKRVLLTGVADEVTAVAAFNDGLIDHYYPKSSLRDRTSIIPLIAHMQGVYFSQFNRALCFEHLVPGSILNDPAVRTALVALFERLDIVEYYLAHNPLGFLLLRADGSRVRCLVAHQREIEAQAEIARRHQAPGRVVRKLSQGRAIAFLPEDPDFYLGREDYAWEECLVPCQPIPRADDWRFGYLENPPLDIDIDPEASCYNRYLRSGQPRGIQ
ncbi:MAG: hypothetical protein AAF513_15170 [Pseudomonadota bacterium]